MMRNTEHSLFLCVAEWNKSLLLRDGPKGRHFVVMSVPIEIARYVLVAVFLPA